MSQYPQSPQPPYPTPPVNYDYYRPGGGDPLAAAKRSSVLMIILGVLTLLTGGCFAAMGQMLPTLDLPAESRAQFEQLQSQLPPGVSVSAILLGVGVAVLFVGLVYLVLGFFVRGGGRGAVITSIVITALVLIYLLINTISALVGPLANPAGICVVIPPLALFGLLMVWLAQAAKAGPAASSAAAAMQQYQQQMWYYQQQQQAYQQQQMQQPYPQQPPVGGYPLPPQQQSGGYGYGAPQQPTPPQSSPQQSNPQWKDPNAPPPKGDPRRPLHLAVRSARVLGVLFVLLGLCGTSAMLYVPRATGGGQGMMSMVFLLAAVLFYLGPGACYLIFAGFLANYRPWAVTATLVLAALHFLLVLVAGGGTMITFFSAPTITPAMWVMAIVVAFVLLAVGQMLYHLIRSYESVRHPPFGRTVQEGFAPVFPVPPAPGG